MTPESAICDVVTRCFPGSQVKVFREEMLDFYKFSFRLVVDQQVYGLDHRIPGEVVDAHPEAAAKELVSQIRTDMERMLPQARRSPLSGMPMSSIGFRDGWYDTDQARRDKARLLELARIATEEQEAEKARKSILDTIAQRALREA